MRQAVAAEPANQHYARKLADLEAESRKEAPPSRSADTSVVEYSFRAPRGSGDASTADGVSVETPHYSPFTGLQVSVATAQITEDDEAVFSTFY